MTVIPVELGERHYDVVVGSGVRHELPRIIRERAPRALRCAIVTTPHIRRQSWFDLTSGIDDVVIEVADGEAAKTPEAFIHLVNELSRAKLSRHDVVVGVGGGATTDVAGFAAATYLRGLPLINVATTVAGQVDAAIGGKTGVNLTTGKNLLGAFHQPLAVLCDLDTLITLPARDVVAGNAEVAKCWLLEGRRALDLAGWSQHDLTVMAVQLKARVVASDEREGGVRATLNFGHTLAHAMEKLSLAHGGDIRHGEAVAVGLTYAARLAHRLGRVDENYVENVRLVVHHFGLRDELGNYDIDELVDAMGHDKKAHHDLTFVLPGDGGFETVSHVDPTTVADELQKMKG